MARLRASWRTSLPVVQQPRNPQSESIARSPYHACSAEPALQAHVPSAAIDRRTPMMKYAIAAAGLVAFTAPGLATSGSGSSTTTTTTTGGGSETYYVVRDPSTKRCTVTTEKPTSTTTTVVGDTVYKTRTEAEGATKTTKVCTE